MIRQCIQEGNLKEAQALLGRDLSIYKKIETGRGVGRKIGIPTLNFRVQGLCLPPYGVYVVMVEQGTTKTKGVANLGLAPTVRTLDEPILEVHLLEDSTGLDFDQPMETHFKCFIRNECKFESLDALRQQILLDISFAQKYFFN